MKANAPEKIYGHIKDKPCEITFSEVIEKECSNIEYIRADAFIEKVIEKVYGWLEPIIINYAGYYVGNNILRNFKNDIMKEIYENNR